MLSSARSMSIAVPIAVSIALATLPGFAQTVTLRLPAQVEPYERAELYAKASGFVASVQVDIGDTIKRGDVLAELSIPELEQERLQKVALLEQADAAIQQAEAQLSSAQAKVAASRSQLAVVQSQLEKHRAEITFAQSELSRITSLVSARAVNAALKDEKQQKLSAAEAALSGAEAEVVLAEANIRVAVSKQQQAQADLAFAHSQRKVSEAGLRQVQTLVQYATVRAPFDGTIAHRGIDTGDFVLSAASAKDEPVFVLNRVDRFRIVFDVPESAAALIKLGQPVELRLDSLKDQVFAGQIKRTSGELDKRTRTLRAEAEVADPGRRLSPGMYGMVTTTTVPPQ